MLELYEHNKCLNVSAWMPSLALECRASFILQLYSMQCGSSMHCYSTGRFSSYVLTPFASWFFQFLQCKQLHSHCMELYKQHLVCSVDWSIFGLMCVRILYGVGREGKAVRILLAHCCYRALGYSNTRVICLVSLYNYYVM